VNYSIIGVTPAFDVFKLKASLLANDAGEWGQEPGNDAIGVIRSTNFSNQGYLFLDDIAYRSLSASKKKEKLINAGDILIERSGGSNTQPVGRVGFIDKAVADKAFVFANFIQRICVDRDIFFPKFAYYCLQQMYEMGITSSMQFQTTGIRNLDYKYYLKSKLPKPELNEQKAIAGILSKVDEAIEAVENSIKAAERLKKSLMQNLLTGKLKPDGTWRSEDEFYVDDKFGKVPKGWKVKRVKDVFHINGETLPSKTDPDFKFRYITIEAVNTESIDFNSCPEYVFKESPGRARRIIKSGDILISGVRPNLKAFAVYEPPNEENWICSTGFFVLSQKNEEDNNFHFYQILSSIGEAQFFSYVAGTNYPAIGDRDIRNMKLFRPPYDEQCQISDKIGTISKANSKNISKIQSLKTLKKSLMQNLLTGKVRVDVEKINKLLEEM